ncbi:hypothetical protein CEXT_31021 [Caerostris extrusa]|uniref:Secreted protein n=1 Tax=Caerostris extrusa TaxID=172846 RepID=A0AAV4SD36_CAEEX|nr:hypothetical protein CEXT_31021 [Caerostris extrusa]
MFYIRQLLVLTLQSFERSLSSVCHFGWNGNEKRHLRAITIAANVKKSHQSARNKRSKSRQVPRLITVHLSPQRCPFVCIAQAQGSTTR